MNGLNVITLIDNKISEDHHIYSSIILKNALEITLPQYIIRVPGHVFSQQENKRQGRLKKTALIGVVHIAGLQRGRVLKVGMGRVVDYTVDVVICVVKVRNKKRKGRSIKEGRGSPS